MMYTPGPWTINEKRDDAWEIMLPEYSEVWEQSICTLNYTGGNAEANAAYIVRCVNSHADLLAALEIGIKIGETYRAIILQVLPDEPVVEVDMWLIEAVAAIERTKP